ncbi:hypothetical protein DIZ76_013402 [Coccidioides immitis]|nr:hypothetical protein DIZ76_013402 [Coccidioides immitis]
MQGIFRHGFYISRTAKLSSIEISISGGHTGLRVMASNYPHRIRFQMSCQSRLLRPLSPCPKVFRTSNSHIARYTITTGPKGSDTRYLHELGRFRGLLSTAFSIDITMLNDTGSNTLTVFNTALLALAIPPDYLGFGANIPITTAGGMVRRQQITVEIQLLDSQGNAVSDWVLKQGIVTPATTGACRLSGNGIRQSLYFATAPGNQHLYVAEKKNGIVEQLPAL